MPELRAFCDLVEVEFDDPVEFAVDLFKHDVTEGVVNAYYTAKWAADHYFRALRIDAGPVAASETRTLDFARFRDPEWREKLLDAIGAEQ